MGLFAALFQIGTFSTVNQKEAEIFMEEFEKLVIDIDGFGIFTHNV